MRYEVMDLYIVDAWLKRHKISFSDATELYRCIRTEGQTARGALKVCGLTLEGERRNRKDIELPSKTYRQAVEQMADSFLYMHDPAFISKMNMSDATWEGYRKDLETHYTPGCGSLQYWGNIVQDDDGEP